MVEKFNLGIKSIEGEKAIEFEARLVSKNNSHAIVFENSSYLLKIALKDIVDVEEFCNLLEEKTSKIILHCTLEAKLRKKEYKGLRKIRQDKGLISLSLGGIRIVFSPEQRQKLLCIAQSLKLI